MHWEGVTERLREPLPFAISQSCGWFPCSACRRQQSRTRVVVSLDIVHPNLFSGVYPLASPAGFEESARRRNGWHSGAFTRRPVLSEYALEVRKSLVEPKHVLRPQRSSVN